MVGSVLPSLFRLVGRESFSAEGIIDQKYETVQKNSGRHEGPHIIGEQHIQMVFGGKDQSPIGLLSSKSGFLSLIISLKI